MLDVLETIAAAVAGVVLLLMLVSAAALPLLQEWAERRPHEARAGRRSRPADGPQADRRDGPVRAG